MEEYNTLIEAKRSFAQRLKDAAKKELEKLRKKATDPETYINAASSAIKNTAAETLTRVKQGKSLKSKNR